MTNFKSYFKLSDRIKKPELIWIALLTGVLGSFSTQPATAEGSRQLVIGGGTRPASEWRPNDVLGDIPRTTILQVYAQQNEIINLGSSAVGVSRTVNSVTTFGNAVIKDSGGTVVRDCRVDQPGDGVITSDTQETAGPLPAAGGYTPCTYTVPSTGIYRVEFHGPDGANPAAGNGQINILRPIVGNTTTFPDNFNDQQGSRVALWDVTVTDSGGTARPGRLFTNYLSLITGGNGPNALVNSDLFVVTRDGYQYNVETNNLDPNGFIFFSTNRGFVDSNTNQTLYRSINLNGPDNNLTLPSGVTLQPPFFPDTPTDATNKIFFNQPDPVALTALGITSTPQLPQPATGFQFRGQEGTVGQSGTNPLQGSFEFNNPNTIIVSYKIVIDTNRDGDYVDPEDRVLIGTAANGFNQVTWDGRDELGTAVPAGNFSYGATISLNAGEVHFPLFDPENAGGLVITRALPVASNPNTVYYDDRGVRDITLGGPPNPLYNLTGLDSSSRNVHRFGDGTGAGFGDKKGIDTWTFLPSDTVTVQDIVTLKQADLLIEKTLDPQNPTPVSGGPVNYIIRVTNLGPSPLNTVGSSQDIDARVQDTIDARISNVTWTCAAASGAPAGSLCRDASGTGNTIDTRVNLPVNGVVQFNVTGTLAANIAAGTSIANTATVLRPKDVTDPNYFGGLGTNNNQSSISFTVTQSTADVTIAKTQTSANPVTPGQNVTYNLVVTASGNTDSTNVQVADTIPAGFSFVSNSGDCTTAFPCNLGTIPTGQTRTITTTLAVPANYSGASPVTNIANVSSSNDSNANNNTANAQTTITSSQTADVTIAKTQTSANPVTPGQNVTYNLVVTASGNTDSTNVQVADTIPAGFSFVSNSGDCTTAFPCNLGTIPTGQTRTITTTLAVPANYSGASPVTNIANVSSSNDSNANNNTANAQTTITSSQTADVTIAKTQTSANPVAPGQNVTYNLVVTASGNTDSTNVQVADTIPAGFSFVSNSGDCTTAFPCNLGTIPTGQTRTITTTLAVPANYNGGSPVTNTANVSASNDTNPNNNTANASTNIQPSADVVTTKTGPSTIEPSGSITYTITTTNNGPSPAINVVVRDNIPSETTFSSASDGGTFANGVVTFPVIPSLASGASVTRTVTVAVPASGGPLVNRASNTSDTPDPTPNNNDGSQPPAQVTTTIAPPIADVVTTKTGPATVAPGGSITYIIITTNNGPGLASNVVVRDTIPPGTTFVSASDGGTFANGVVTFPAISSLPTGINLIRTVTVTAPASGGPLVNRVSSSSDTPDPTPNNNDGSQPPAQVTTTITQSSVSADVITTKTGPSTIAPGGSITYTITTTNNGPSPASNVVIRDTIPPETTFTSASDGGTFANGVVTFPAISSLASNTSVTRTVTVTAPASGGPLVNRAANTSDTPDPNTANNDGSQPPAQVVTTLTTSSDSADVITTKTGPSTVAPGGTINYTITTTNNGPSPASNVVIRDTLPAGATFSSASDGGNFANGVVTFPTIPSLASGASVTRTITITAPTSGGPLINRASNTSDTPDPTPANNDGSQPPAQVVTTLTTSSSDTADVITTKTGPSTVAPGGTINYTITTTNNGPSPASNVVIRDTLPAGATFSSASDGGNFANGVVTFPTIPSLASGASVTRTITITAPTSGGPLINRASNTSDTSDPTPANNDGSLPAAQVVTTLTTSSSDTADVITTKTGPSTIAPGGSITYTITTANNGPSAASNVVIRDTIPPETTFNSASDGGTFANGVVTFPAISSLASNTSVTRTVTVTAPASGGPLINRAANTSDTPDPTPANNDGSQPPAQVVTTLTTSSDSADVVTTKTGPSTVAPGGTINYTITTTNNGPSPASNVVIRDTLPAGATFSSASDGGNFANGVVTFPTIPSLASGASVTRTITITAPTSGGPLINRASNTSDTPDPTPTNNDGSQPPAQVVTTLSTSTNSADVITTKTGPSTIAPGGTIAYTITTRNNGPNAASNVIIRDTIPPETTFSSASDGGTFANGVVTFPAISSLASGASVTRTITVTAPASGGPLINRAANTSDTPDPTPANNDGSLPAAQVVTTLTTPADVVTTKTGPTEINPGGTITYTITAQNNGPSAATNVIIRDTIPAEATFNNASDGGIFVNGVVVFPAIPSLASGASVTRTITVTAPTTGGPLVNRVASTADNPDPNPDNNNGSQPPSQVTTTLAPQTTNVQVTQSVSPTPVPAGSNVTLTAGVTNNGTVPATNVVLTNPLPPNVTFVSATPSQGTCTFANNTVTCNLGTINPGQTVNVSIVVSPTQPGNISSPISVSGSNIPSSNTNNVVTPIQVIPAQTDVEVKQTAPAEPQPVGNNTTFNTEVTNKGPVPATSVTLTNPLPPNTTFVSATPSQGTCGLTNNNIVCNLGDINPGQTVTVPIVVTPTAPGTLTNQVTIASPSDSTPANNQASAIAQVVPREPRVRLVKRITSVTRSGSVFLFNDLVDDPTDQNDNAPGWSQFRPLGLVTVPVSEPVRSGDTVEYTIYYLSDGTTPADNVKICDAIPTNTTFIPDAFGSGRGMQLNLAGVISALTNDEDGDVGRFFSALAPLPTGNPCVNSNNENGTVLFSIDRIPNTTGNNFGFVRFRVRID